MLPPDPPTPAAQRVAAEIASHGPITFARFMALALFDPDVGYYTRADAGPGAAADYLTSSEIHSAFAVLLTGQLVEMWRLLGEPAPFWLVEVGPGSGVFVADVLRTLAATAPGLAGVIRVALVEASPALRRQQESRLAGLGSQVIWHDPESSPVSPLGAGCVFANELLDALPVHRVRMTDAGLREVYVVGTAEQLRDASDAPSSLDLAAQIAEGGGRLAPGQAGEVSLAAGDRMAAMARFVEPGYVVMLDYGEPATLLYGDRFPDGTLCCYWRHTRHRDPYRYVGQQDITAHVDLSAVTRAGEAAGLRLVGATRQARLLQRLGIDEIAAQIELAGMGRAETRAHRAALTLLGDPRELGNLAALAFNRNAPAAPLRGFGDGPVLPLRVPGDLLVMHADPALLARTGRRG